MRVDAPRGAQAPVLAAWDTCTARGTLAVGSGGLVLRETYFKTEKGHTGSLMPLVEMTFLRVGIAPEDVGYVAVGTGPGTFTGVKVGLATAKAVAMACGVPLVGVSTLDILAGGAPPGADLILSTVDARRGMLYAAAYRPGEGVPDRVSEYICGPPAQVAEVARSLGYGTVAVVGEAPSLLVELLEDGGELMVAGDPFPKGREIVAVATELISRGRVGDAASVAPIYLRKPT
ncbi:MAG: tRNA (adenosine(37)-N6)-threonylcarbamoyltransferase complex dimerization subunit type 1 TsaB [Actinobacteria bacterium]|nr:tRNA (adenosine(37)-N6)-threonylcarbamoyltransferase complex dimerization subunit type 1 TsaB [Actinomycetota bacterium]MBU4301458.1 tRNA (adenosine(37)-N6)-threonylcarbamoyltransferase complex dimerization subunit type 1 TsaB [Actinomycetota bacterium]MBU4385456.1 tRNA (adenosine(37)-N6)-threonylcarbamoyltransferase complex dimerization subunit type 1 TsaB [Actinomycetota bacterium]MBU4490806.1 tRNA (adenosine(37)-N6)-threonylcarbamoyltransferase complex dimerization subunit type 1 TsaB [Act